MRIIDWSSDVCSSDLSRVVGRLGAALAGLDGDFANDLGEDLAALGGGGVLASFDGGAATHGKTLVLRGEPAILLEAGPEGPGAARRANAAGRSGGSGRSPGTRPSARSPRPRTAGRCGWPRPPRGRPAAGCGFPRPEPCRRCRPQNGRAHV